MFKFYVIKFNILWHLLTKLLLTFCWNVFYVFSGDLCLGGLLIFGCLKEIFILIFQFNVRLNTTTKVTFMEFVPRFQGQYRKFPALILSHNQVNIYKKKNPKLCEILGKDPQQLNNQPVKNQGPLHDGRCCDSASFICPFPTTCEGRVTLALAWFFDLAGRLISESYCSVHRQRWPSRNLMLAVTTQWHAL